MPRKTCLWIVWIYKELGRLFRHVVNKKKETSMPFWMAQKVCLQLVYNSCVQLDSKGNFN